MTQQESPNPASQQTSAHTPTHTYVHIPTHVCTHTYAHAHAYVCDTHACVQTHMPTCNHTHTHTRVCICMCACEHVWDHTHTNGLAENRCAHVPARIPCTTVSMVLPMMPSIRSKIMNTHNKKRKPIHHPETKQSQLQDRKFLITVTTPISPLVEKQDITHH